MHQPDEPRVIKLKLGIPQSFTDGTLFRVLNVVDVKARTQSIEFVFLLSVAESEHKSPIHQFYIKHLFLKALEAP